MTSNEPFVVAVVLTWNDTELTTKCLNSILASDYKNLDVVLVDNGSKPPVGPTLSETFPGVEVLQIDDNRGFSGGANFGMRHALNKDPDYVHLIGNDSTLAPDAISKLVAELQSRPTVGAAGPLLLEPAQKRIVQFYTATYNRDTAEHFHHHTQTPYSDREWPTVESDFIPCVALMFRAKALREVGLFDETFGTSWEDFDLCIRMNDAGWKYLVVGDAEAVHIDGHTTGLVSPYITYYMIRNRLICISRYSRKGTWPRRGFYILRTLWWQVKGYGLTNWTCHKAFLHGILDYLINVRGERRAKYRAGL